MKISTISNLAAGTLLLVCAGAAQAVVFTDRATFEAAISIAYTEDFETLGPGTTTLATPLLLPSGLTVSAPGNNMYTAGPGQSTNPTQAFGSNNPITDSMDFDLGGDFAAFGADFFQNFGAGAQGTDDIQYQLQFFDDGGLVDTIVGMVSPNGGSFIGYTGASVFDRVVVLSTPTDSFEVADNVTVGDGSAAVPEPATLLILGLGLVGLGVVRRRDTA